MTAETSTVKFSWNTHMNKGFSLLEILISLSIGGIMLACALPSIRHLIAEANDRILQASLLQMIALAKEEVIAKHISVSLCGTENFITCTNDWSYGQIMFVDTLHNGKVTDPHQLLHVNQQKIKFGMLYWRAFPSWRDFVHFPSAGLLTTTNGTFWYCHKDELKPSWAIMVSNTGRTRVLRGDARGEIHDHQGKLLLCR